MVKDNAAYDLVAIGRAGVDLYSLDFNKPIKDATKFAKYVGGTSANVVVGASRLGLNAALVTRVSNDELGEFIIDFLRKERVETKYVKMDNKRKTGIVFAEISPRRDGKFIFYRENAADLFVEKEDIEPSLIRNTRSLIVTGTAMSANPSAETNYYAAKLAREYGVKVVLNLDWRPSLWNTTKEVRVRRYTRVLAISEIVIGNENEYMAATGVDNIEEAVGSIPESKQKILVITRGDRGSDIRYKNKKMTTPVFEVKLLKGLGAGDGFIAGFLYGHLKGWDLYHATRFGNAVGAMVVMGHSCSESMPTYSQVVKFLKKKKADILDVVS